MAGMTKIYIEDDLGIFTEYVSPSDECETNIDAALLCVSDLITWLCETGPEFYEHSFLERSIDELEDIVLQIRCQEIDISIDGDPWLEIAGFCGYCIDAD